MTPDAELVLHLEMPRQADVVRCRITEGISMLTHVELEVASTEDLQLEGVLEAPAVLELIREGSEARRWTLRVGHIDFVGDVEGSLRYRVNLYPVLWLLRFTQNTRKFRKQSAKQIVSTVLDESGVAHRWELSREPEKRNYCVQYRETNLDFVLRLLEWEGIYYTFADDGTLVLADTSVASAAVTDVPFELLEAEGALSWDDVGIFSFSKGARVASGAATVNDFNWKTPKVKLIDTAAADKDAELEVYDYPSGYRRPDQAPVLAKRRLEALRVPARFVTGNGNVTDFAAARAFTFGGNTGPRFAGEYVLAKVEHQYFNRLFQKTADNETSEGVNYQNEFHAIPKGVPFRPEVKTQHPHIAGCHTGMVRGPEGEEIHTDKYGRFRLQFHWDREAVGSDDDSRWMRVLQETATSMTIARVGWEYSVAYIDGDPDRPIGFARNINGVMQAEYAQPANKTRMTIKTPTYPSNGGFNELRLEDLAGQQHFDWKAEKDFTGLVENDRTEHVGNDELHTVGTTRDHAVENNQTVSIGGTLDVAVGGSYRFGVNEDRTKKVGGDEKIKVSEVMVASVTGKETETVGGNRKTEAGEKSGSINRMITEEMERKVAGSSVTKGDGNIALIVQEDFTEDVAGSKFTQAKNGSISGKVGGNFNLDVGGTLIRLAGAAMGYSAKRSQIQVGASSSMTSGEQITINGDHITLVAASSFVLKSGGLEIAMTPGSTAIKGNMRMESGDVIAATGNPDNLTK